jgi:transposase
MRPKGTPEQLAARRARGLALLAAGKSPAQVAERLGVTERTVRRWRQEARRPKRRAKRPPGRPSRLSPAQLRRLERELKRGAYAQGYAEDYWTLDRVAQVIWQLFGVRYHPSSVWHILRRLGWSSQRPQRVALQRDDQAVADWQRSVWPRIKKVAATGRDPDF